VSYPCESAAGELVLAALAGDAHGADDPVAAHVAHLGLKVKYVAAPREQLLRVIALYYPSKISAA